MPHPVICKAIEDVVKNKDLPDSSAERILAWLKEAEGGSFAAADKREQLHKILEVMHGFSNGDQEEV